MGRGSVSGLVSRTVGGLADRGCGSRAGEKGGQAAALTPAVAPMVAIRAVVFMTLLDESLN